jgi:LacI family transcriptional regulator
MITIRDIAREAGFSVSTVSRVLGGHPDVSPATAAAVQAVVERHNFAVNRNARNLKRTHSPVVLILVKGHSNMFFASMLEHVQLAVERTGNSTVVQYLDEDEDEVVAAEQLILEVKPRGLVFLGGDPGHFESSARRVGERYPAVVMTNSMEPFSRPGLSSVTTGDAAGAELAVSHLLGQGHRRIGVVGGVRASTTSRLRLDGVLAAFARNAVPFDLDAAYVATRYSLEAGHAAALRLVRQLDGLTAIYAMSDIMAVGAVRALRDSGLRVPEDVSLIGHDGIDLTGYIVPRITTVRQPQALMAERGVSILMRHISGDLSPQYESIPVELVPGESVRPV